jgi:Flp pilus assembly protein TadD
MGWVTPLPEGIEANSFTAHPLSSNDALIAIAEMHVNERDHQQDSIGELQQALAADPNNFKAESDLGYAYFVKRDYDHAEPYLEKAVASGSKDAMVHFYYAMLLQQKFRSANPSAEQLERQRRELEKTIALEPNMAAAYNLLSINAHQRKDSGAAVQAALQAVALDRRNELYAVNLASAYLAAQKIPEAKSVINQLRNSHDPQVLTTVSSMDSFIAQWESYHRSSNN